MNKSNYVNGNTVLAPQYQPDWDNEYKKLKEAKKRNKAIHREKNIKKKASVLLNIVGMFIFGTLLVWRYSMIYGMQQNLNQIKSNIQEVSRDNESLKIELIKFNSMGYIEDYAENTLKMVKPAKDTAVSINLDKQNFTIDVKENEKSVKKNLWAKILSIIF